MNFRFGAVAALVCSVLLACPGATTNKDGGGEGYDAANPMPGDCSGGCAANQICNTETHTCVDGCGGCDAGVCVKSSAQTFECVELQTQCNGVVCADGQVACLAGGCSCLSGSAAAFDSCSGNGQFCERNGCVSPKASEQCKEGGAACPPGYVCNPVFGDDQAICTKPCNAHSECGQGELCSGVGCLAAGLFGGQECNQQIDGGTDAGLLRLTVGVSNVCLQKGTTGAFTETTPTGNCTYAFFKLYDQSFTFSTCRPPGTAAEGQACLYDYSKTAVATSCGTGLECLVYKAEVTDGGPTGMCERMCNAAEPRNGFEPTPACNTGEACVNMYRLDDLNSVVGTCLKTCNVFDGTKNTCAPVNGVPHSCVPTTANGRFVSSSDGSGICVPQKTSIAAVGQQCSDADALHGATCASGQLCVSTSVTEKPVCQQVCDVQCSKPLSDGGTLARCATEPNAYCPSGKTCKRVTSTTGSIVGFCQ